jgi:hypothetical protein
MCSATELEYDLLLARDLAFLQADGHVTSVSNRLQ